MKIRTQQDGFTLIEMIVSTGLFVVVMLVSVAALLALVSANRKAQALQSVMNNLDVALDGMVRAARMGTNYHCGNSAYTTLVDCVSGDTVFAFEPYGNGPTDPPTVYTYDTDGTVCGLHRICRSKDGGVTTQALTAPEVTIDDMKFFVVGTAKGCASNPCDTTQPKVVVVVKGSAGAIGTKARTTFHIQATAVQRALDI